MELAFSWEGWKVWIKAWISGTPQKDMEMSSLVEPKIEEIFVIERNSGILIGSYSKKESLDGDMVAGMLTAIKAFVEDAFNADAQELESIDYENYKVIIKSFNSFFIAVVASGVANATFKDKLDDQLLNFAERVLTKAANAEAEEVDQELITEGLKEHFNDFEDVSE
jgi:hemerythrin